jgi:hypothetical protein
MQLKRIMHNLKRLRSIIPRNNAADFDLAGGDVLNIDLRIRQGLFIQRAWR